MSAALANASTNAKKQVLIDHFLLKMFRSGPSKKTRELLMRLLDEKNVNNQVYHIGLPYTPLEIAVMIGDEKLVTHLVNELHANIFIQRTDRLEPNLFSNLINRISPLNNPFLNNDDDHGNFNEEEIQPYRRILSFLVTKAFSIDPLKLIEYLEMTGRMAEIMDIVPLDWSGLRTSAWNRKKHLVATYNKTRKQTRRHRNKSRKSRKY